MNLDMRVLHQSRFYKEERETAVDANIINFNTAV